MSDANRREFVRRLGGLAALSITGCKIEPILDLPPSVDELPLAFPDLPPQIPDQLEDAEVTLRAMTDELLDDELALLMSGELRLRASEDVRVVSHLTQLMRRFGLEPAGNRGGWLLPVPLDITEPTGAEPRVTLRPESEAKTDPARTDANPDAAPAPPAKSPPDSPAKSPPDAEPEPRALELASLGAFRQRGLAIPHDGLLVGLVRPYQTPLASESYAGRVALIRAPKDLDLDDRESPARVDLLLSTVRDAGAIGCLLLTDAGPEAIERFRELWKRQVRRAGQREGAMLIEGVLGAEGRAAIEAVSMHDESWVLDVALATRQYELETHDIIGRITGRERPHEAVVLTCSWDTPDPTSVEIDTLRLLATLATFAQLAEWSRRSTPPRYSLILLLTADAGFSAGQSVHAAWASNFGAEVSVLLGLDRPTLEPLPAVSLSGHFDAALAELVRGVVAADDRDLLIAEQLTMPSLAPYLRYPAPVMAVGAPDPAALELGEDEGDEGEQPMDPRAGIHADLRLLRNLMLALAARR